MPTTKTKHVLIKYLFFGLVALCLLSILIFATRFTRGVTTYTPFYNNLIDALFHGRTDIHTPFLNIDLLYFRNKVYLQWGPSPVLFILPFYLIGGTLTSDILYAVLAGVINVMLFYYVLQEFSKYFSIKLSRFLKIVLVSNFAFISPTFFLIFRTGIWSVYQLIGILYLLLGYWFFFKFLNSAGKRFLFLFLAALFFNLAWLSRYSLLLHAFLFIFPLYLMYQKKLFSAFRKSLFIIGSLYIAGMLIFCLYNYSRFQNPFNPGFNYQIHHPKFGKIMQSGKWLSTTSLPRNAYYYFLQSPLTYAPPFIRVNPVGSSIFLVYPFTLLFFYLRKKHLSQYKHFLMFFIISSIVIIINIIFLLALPFTGETQFGIRYFYDVVPILLLLLAVLIHRIPRSILIAELIAGIYINFVGTMLFIQSW